jgi:hypothetical protein
MESLYIRLMNSLLFSRNPGFMHLTPPSVAAKDFIQREFEN